MTDWDLLYWLSSSRCNQLLPCEWCWQQAERRLAEGRTIAAQALYAAVDCMETAARLVDIPLPVWEEDRAEAVGRRHGRQSVLQFLRFAAHDLEVRNW